MTDRQSKGLPPDPEAAPKPEGFGKQGRPDGGAGPGGHAADHAGAGPGPAAGAVGRPSAESDLYQDALKAAAALKEKHAAFFAADPKGFSRLVRKANAAAFRRKPGPAPDPNVLKAAEERVGGAKWPDLYQHFIPHYAAMPEFTKDCAEAGFRRKVSDYIQRDPRLKSERKTRRKSRPKSHRKYNRQRRPPDPHA